MRERDVVRDGNFDRIAFGRFHQRLAREGVHDLEIGDRDGHRLRGVVVVLVRHPDRYLVYVVQVRVLRILVILRLHRDNARRGIDLELPLVLALQRPLPAADLLAGGRGPRRRPRRVLLHAGVRQPPDPHLHVLPVPDHYAAARVMRQLHVPVEDVRYPRLQLRVLPHHAVRHGGQLRIDHRLAGLEADNPARIAGVVRALLGAPGQLHRRPPHPHRLIRRLRQHDRNPRRLPLRHHSVLYRRHRDVVVPDRHRRHRVQAVQRQPLAFPEQDHAERLIPLIQQVLADGDFDGLCQAAAVRDEGELAHPRARHNEVLVGGGCAAPQEVAHLLLRIYLLVDAHRQLQRFPLRHRLLVRLDGHPRLVVVQDGDVKVVFPPLAGEEIGVLVVGPYHQRERLIRLRLLVPNRLVLKGAFLLAASVREVDILPFQPPVVQHEALLPPVPRRHHVHVVPLAPVRLRPLFRQFVIWDAPEGGLREAYREPVPPHVPRPAVQLQLDSSRVHPVRPLFALGRVPLLDGLVVDELVPRFIVGFDVHRGGILDELEPPAVRRVADHHFEELRVLRDVVVVDYDAYRLLRFPRGEHQVIEGRLIVQPAGVLGPSKRLANPRLGRPSRAVDWVRRPAGPDRRGARIARGDLHPPVHRLPLHRRRRQLRRRQPHREVRVGDARLRAPFLLRLAVRLRHRLLPFHLDPRLDPVVVYDIRRPRWRCQQGPHRGVELHRERLRRLPLGVLQRLHRDEPLVRLPRLERHHPTLQADVVAVARLRRAVVRLPIHLHHAAGGLGEPDLENDAVPLRDVAAAGHRELGRRVIIPDHPTHPFPVQLHHVRHPAEVHVEILVGLVQVVLPRGNPDLPLRLPGFDGDPAAPNADIAHLALPRNRRAPPVEIHRVGDRDVLGHGLVQPQGEHRLLPLVHRVHVIRQQRRRVQDPRMRYQARQRIAVGRLVALGCVPQQREGAVPRPVFVLHVQHFRVEHLDWLVVDLVGPGRQANFLDLLALTEVDGVHVNSQPGGTIVRAGLRVTEILHCLVIRRGHVLPAHRQQGHGQLALHVVIAVIGQRLAQDDAEHRILALGHAVLRPL